MDALLLSLVSAAVLTWLFTCVALWIWAAGRAISGHEVVPYEPRPSFPCGVVEVLLGAGTFILTGAALARLLGVVPADAGETESAGTHFVPLIVANSAATLTAVAAVLAWAGALGLGFRQMGLVPKWRDLPIGIGAVLMLLPPLLVLQAFLSSIYEYHHPLLEVLKQPQPPLTLIIMAISSTIVAPLTEEFFFRGLLQGWLGRLAEGRRGDAADAPLITAKAATPTKLLGGQANEADSLNPYAAGDTEVVYHGPRPRPWWPIVASSLLFAAVHIGQGPAPISLFFLSLGLGYVYRQTGRIWPAVILHMGLNGLSTAATIVTTTLTG